MNIVLDRDRFGRERLWKCAECGKPFTLGWGDYCNACIAAQQRHRELIAAIRESRPQPAWKASMRIPEDATKRYGEVE